MSRKKLNSYFGLRKPFRLGYPRLVVLEVVAWEAVVEKVLLEEPRVDRFFPFS